MKLPKSYLQLLLPWYLLFPLHRLLARQHADHFLLGQSSSFWAGVTAGVFIVCAAAFIALVVFHMYAIKPTLRGDAQ